MKYGVYNAVYPESGFEEIHWFYNYVNSSYLTSVIKTYYGYRETEFTFISSYCSRACSAYFTSPNFSICPRNYALYMADLTMVIQIQLVLPTNRMYVQEPSYFASIGIADTSKHIINHLWSRKFNSCTYHYELVDKIVIIQCF